MIFWFWFQKIVRLRGNRRAIYFELKKCNTKKQSLKNGEKMLNFVKLGYKMTATVYTIAVFFLYLCSL